MLGGDPAGTLAGDPVQPPPGSAFAHCDLGILPFGLEEPLVGKSPKRLVERAV